MKIIKYRSWIYDSYEDEVLGKTTLKTGAKESKLAVKDQAKRKGLSGNRYQFVTRSFSLSIQKPPYITRCKSCQVELHNPHQHFEWWKDLKICRKCFNDKAPTPKGEGR